MKIIFTKHAKQRMIERGINLEKIKENIDFPDYIITNLNKVESYKKVENRVLKVVYVKGGNFIKIVTLIWK